MRACRAFFFLGPMRGVLIWAEGLVRGYMPRELGGCGKLKEILKYVCGNCFSED